MKRDKIEVLIKLAEAHRTAGKTRHAHKWKVMIAVLTFYVLCVSAMLTPQFSNFPVNNVFIWLVFSFIAIATTIYMWNLSKSNEINTKFAHLCEDKIIELTFANEDNDFIDRYSKTGESTTTRSLINRFWQIIIIMVFYLVSSLLVTS